MAITIKETKKKKTKLTHKIIKVPVRYAHDVTSYIEEFKQFNSYDDVQIVKEKILLNHLVDYDGAFVRLTSDREWANAQQLILPDKFDTMLLAIEKKWNHFKHDHNLLLEFFDVYSELVLKHYKHYESYGNKVIQNRPFFIDLKLEQKLEAVSKMLIVTKASKTYVPIMIGNFKLGIECGRMTKKTALLQKTILINQSLSGLHTSTLKL